MLNNNGLCLRSMRSMCYYWCWIPKPMLIPRSTVSMFIATPSDQGTMDFLVHTMDFLVHTASNRLRVFWCYYPSFRSTYCMWVKAAPIISMEKVYTMMSVCTELHVLTAAAHSCALLITPTQLHKFLVSGKEEDGVGIFGVREGGGWGEGCPVLPSNVRE